jgi:PAS domain S-box-containing protein
MACLAAENPNPVLRVGADGVIQYANAASAALLDTWHRRRGEIVPDDWCAWIAGALAAHASTEVEVTAGGRYFSCLLVPVGDGACVFAHDIADRKLTETALRESEERFRAIFQQAAVGVSCATLDGRYLEVNERFTDIVGYTAAELRDRTFQQITYPPDLAADEALLRRLVAGKLRTYFLEKRYVCKNGALRWVDLTVSLAPDGHNRGAYLIAVVQDISARKESEAARQEAEQRFSHVLENVAAAAGIFSSDECITYCNPYLLELTGWSKEEVIGRNWLEVFVPPEDRDRLRAALMAGMHEDRIEIAGTMLEDRHTVPANGYSATGMQPTRRKCISVRSRKCIVAFVLYTMNSAIGFR